MKIRLKDIAEQAGVSVGAVSQVLNDKPIRISDKKKQMILSIAKEQNYTPNIAARSLVSHKTNTIGLVIPDINNPFFSNLAKTMENRLRELGYLLVLVNSNDVFQSEKELIHLLLNRGVDGLILVLSHEAYAYEKELRAMLEEINVPFVLADRELHDFQGSQIFYDNRLGGYLATKELLQQGHRKIGVMMNLHQNINCEYRYQGYLKALSEYGIKPKKEWNVPTEFQFEDAYEKADNLLNNKDITGVVAGNDLIALGIIKRAREMSKKVPGDISIVGYDNLFLNDLLEVGLTSIEQDVGLLGKKAVEILLHLLETKEHQQVELTPTLVKRASVENKKGATL